MKSFLSKARRLRSLAAGTARLVRRDGISATARRGARWIKARRTPPVPAASSGPAVTPVAASAASQTLAEAARRAQLLFASLPAESSPKSGGSSGASAAVAVVVPAYQAGEHLADCLESVRLQTHRDWHCYVVDDASTDATAEIALRFSRRDDRFTVLRHGRNTGLSAARNTGMLAADEEWVTFLDADDLLTPSSLERRVATAIDGSGDVSIAGSWCATPLVPAETTLEDVKAFDRNRQEHEVHVGTAGGECPFNAHAPLLRRKLLIDLGGFDERLVLGAEDWDLWHRLLRHGYSILNAPGVAGLYRQRAGSMSRRDQRAHLAVGDRLLADARRPARVEGSISVDISAAAPLGDLDLAAARLRRIALSAGIQAGSIADASELDEGLIEVIEALPAGWVRDLDLAARVRAGLERGLGLGSARHDVDATTDAALGATANSIADRLAKAVAAAPRNAGPDSSDMVACDVVLATPDVAVALETAADVVALLPEIERFQDAGLNVVVIDLESTKGDEGVRPALSAGDVELVSYNHLRLGRIRPRSILIRRPMSPVSHEIALEAERQGIAVLEVDEPPRDARLVENASEAFTKVHSVSTSTPTDTIRSATPTALTGLAGFARQLVDEEGALDPTSIVLLESLRDKHRGETVVIVGNGPSLNDTDLDQLSGVPTFAVNGIFYADERLPNPITYYVVEDTSVFRENTNEIKAYRTDTKLFPTLYKRDFEAEELSPEIGFFRMNAGFYGRGTGTECHPRFSTDPCQRVYCGQSVTIINLQLAYWMGFSRVVLIGMDFSYTIPDDVDRKGDVLTSNSDDVNHFHKDYFGKGKTWKDPKLDRVLANYALARDMFAADGREIVNATVGGNLHLFRRMDLAEAVASPKS